MEMDGRSLDVMGINGIKLKGPIILQYNNLPRSKDQGSDQRDQVELKGPD